MPKSNATTEAISHLRDLETDLLKTPAALMRMRKAVAKYNAKMIGSINATAAMIEAETKAYDAAEQSADTPKPNGKDVEASVQ